MTAPNCEQLIVDGLKGLPNESLLEIVDFVYFVRKRVLQPEAYKDELYDLAARAELKELSRDEDAHLEKEFENYEQLYPRE